MPSVIIVAAGKGKRTGKNIPKAFIKIDGIPLLFFSIEKFKKFENIIIVLPSKYIAQWEQKIKRAYPEINFKIAKGGRRRQDSVFNGLAELDNKDEIVLIHDVARPFLSENLIKRVVIGVEKYGACIPVISIPDTVKKIKNKFVRQTLNRDEIFLVQTPQGFKTGIIKSAYEKVKREKLKITDDSAVVEKMGIDVYCVEGERLNFKITYPEDLILSAKIIRDWKEKNGKK